MHYGIKKGNASNTHFNTHFPTHSFLFFKIYMGLIKSCGFHINLVDASLSNRTTGGATLWLGGSYEPPQLFKSHLIF